MWVALLSGGLVLGAGPLTLLMLVVLVAREEEGVAAGLANLITEGGGFSYAVLLAGAMASLVGAVVMGLSVRRPAVPGALALTPFLLPLLASLLGTSMGIASARAAVSFASPADRAVIMAGATGELMSLQLQALAFATAAAVVVALASLVALGAPGRAPRLVTVVAAGMLVPSLGAAAWRIAVFIGSFKAIAHASPEDRLRLLVATGNELQGVGHVANGALLACLLVVVVGGVVAARFGDRTAATGTAAALLVSAVGFRGLTAATERAMQEPAAPTVAAPPFITLKEGSSRSTEPSSVEEKHPLARYGRWGARWVGVGVEPGTQRAALLEFLRVAHAGGTEVELIGNAEPTSLDRVPAVFKAVASELNDLQLAVPVRVLYEGEVCDKCVGAATLEKDGLHVGERTWKEIERPTTSYEPPPMVEFAWTGTPEELVRAGQLALANGHAVVVRVPTPRE